MTYIDHFNLRSFDLNLLLAFDALMQERSVTRAAARLKVRQPAMSHSLSTLRVLLQDELLVRSGQRMEPTPRALALASSVRRTLEQAQEALLARDSFDAAREDRTVRIGVSEHLEALLLPPLIGTIRTAAPGIRVLARNADRLHAMSMLDDGTIDLAVGCFEPAASWHRAEVMFEETHLACFNPALLPFALPLRLADYVAAAHALVSLKDSLNGCLEEALVRAGIELDVVAASPHILTLAGMAAAAPVVATLPARIARRYAPQFGLATSELPFPLERFPMAVLWHARIDRDPATAWLKDRIRACFAEGAPATGAGLQ